MERAEVGDTISQKEMERNISMEKDKQDGRLTFN
jgi:hypothetical protein